ncbi:MAG: prepilin-type N-terminal cleavage/methylation domain-containing protein [Planctomycetia bacterium]|nr:prepilin-type N-terminal cleavage/methylation domain-containing protein [Planctomycetia bacterium]
MRGQETNRRGVTLIELLIVATIMLLLMVVSVPLLKPMLESQATSNAASVVSTYLNRARSRAILTGRPCGVKFDVWDGSTGVHTINRTNVVTDGTLNVDYAACLVLRQVEVPPVYSGLTEDATVTVSPGPGGTSGTITCNDAYWNTVLDKQKIQFNCMGPYFNLDDATDEVNADDLAGVRVPEITEGVPFKVLCAPRSTMTAPVGLPRGTVVDLTYSGDIDGLYGNNNMTIMFSPSGEVDSVVYGSGTSKIPSHTIYLMIGRWERVPAFSSDIWRSLEEDEIPNFADGTCFWVTVNPRTGMVSTAEVSPPATWDLDVIQVPNYEELTDALSESREFATESKRNIGGY